MTGHVTLPCEVRFISLYGRPIHFWQWLSMVSWCTCSGWMQGWHASSCRFNSWSS